MWDEITYPFLKFNGATIEASEWISNFIPHIIMDVITYPWWDWRSTMLVKVAPGFDEFLISTVSAACGHNTPVTQQCCYVYTAGKHHAILIE